MASRACRSTTAIELGGRLEQVVRRAEHGLAALEEVFEFVVGVAAWSDLRRGQRRLELAHRVTQPALRRFGADPGHARDFLERQVRLLVQ